MNLLCKLGFHKWIGSLPGQKIVEYQGKRWWVLNSPIDNIECYRCGKLRDGALLIPAGWEGHGYIVGKGECED